MEIPLDPAPYRPVHRQTSQRRRRYADKGSWNLHISLPYANAFYSAYGKESQWGAGFLGLSLGLSYHTSDKTFVNLSAAGILDFALPFPVAIDYESPQVKDHRYSILANLSNNHLLLQKRLSLGYGLSYGYDTWNTIHHGIAQEGEKQENIYRTSHSLGFVFPVYYYTRRSFYLGMVYRPMLVQFAHGAHFKYQHTISFDFGWRIRLTR